MYLWSMQKNLKFLLILLLLAQDVWAENWQNTQLNSYFIQGLENTPYGIFAGENDGRLWANPYNGIYSSKDLGGTWSKLGLPGMGINDIKAYAGTVYAATYYSQNGEVGLMEYDPESNTWSHLGPNIPCTSIERDMNGMYLGTTSSGLWTSHDEGETWEQRISNNQIRDIVSNGVIALASTANNTYKSVDGGLTWNEIIPLRGQLVYFFELIDNYAFASTTSGLYRSADLGLSWHRLLNFPNFEPGGLAYYNNILYSSARDVDWNTAKVFFSDNFGDSWENTGLVLDHFSRTQDLVWLFSEPSYLFANISSGGVYRYTIPNSITSNPFLEIPWTTTNSSEQITRITSYFDHAYPMLTAPYPKEPYTESQSTLNFYGVKGYPPEMYYSSHNGIDFSLGYGTPILAPTPGVATFHSCTGCGNTIKIDHLNGYETKYKHLQSQDLITMGQEGVWVETGNLIGKVGMTGVSSGPHLHLEVTKDTNGDGNFEDEDPSGKIDPFGWNPTKYSNDPWPELKWATNEGEKRGSHSLYLWNSPLVSNSKFTSGNAETTVTTNNKTVTLLAGAVTKPATITLKEMGIPQLPESQGNLVYIDGSAFLVELQDQLGNDIQSLEVSAKLELNLPRELRNNAVTNTIKTYVWDNIDLIWEALPTVLDLVEGVVTSETFHFSHFALFADSSDYSAPQTDINISGSKVNSWYIENPVIELSALDNQDPNPIVFFTLNDESGWQIYNQAFSPAQSGISVLRFRSQDMYGNIEQTQSYVVQVDTQNKWKNSLIVKDAFFEVTE
ncbi:hypothetical protein A3K34_00335 [candidate division WWE3 bacterium RIFOXYC1_FULL_40_10]|nr:MAG: hypothetical protein A3K58_00335 [candidate division WWE3 bacterium RIFOXYB1_FULL_40_22]OGC61338.1 MAG: hypothetical protein A3K37_00335 [candidate division WWE3 bacterium RIFOXYA1_FULL_40_11]OGC65721.1 MAG: hypothetical protein A3K34_00335 [candidate division WWE3 bacterium RIFOXYC1_FULL_40_10]OGC67766.1 MAG: hypothetical protein A2450_03150 [candidate division WWE3 bacterium RIFOXYC2_FULL_40_11]